MSNMSYRVYNISKEKWLGRSGGKITWVDLDTAVESDSLDLEDHESDFVFSFPSNGFLSADEWHSRGAAYSLIWFAEDAGYEDGDLLVVGCDGMNPNFNNTVEISSKKNEMTVLMSTVSYRIPKSMWNLFQQ